ncbi:MAG: hypothetical protein AAGF11_19190 [Myxococcota bacterium]
MTGRCRAIPSGVTGMVTGIIAGMIVLGGLFGPVAGVGVAWAAPVRGTGMAAASEAKSPSMTKTRSRALRQARRSALKMALGQVSGSVDPKARKAVLGSAEAWTGSYRIVSETRQGQEVQIEVEVEIDLVRLTKRVTRKGAPKPAFRLGDVTVGPACGEAEGVSGQVSTELSGSGAVALDGKGPPLDVVVECEVLGPVLHTYLRGAHVSVVATTQGQVVARRGGPAFAITPPEAVAAGIGQALLDTADDLVTRRTGIVRLRVRSPMPSARIRRLEAAMRNSVLGVDRVGVAAIERGMVELHVRGTLDAKTLARRLRALSLPGFSLSVVDVELPDALTVRLE